VTVVTPTHSATGMLDALLGHVSAETRESRSRHSALDHHAASRFLTRVSWAIVAALGVMATAMWMAPFARAAGHVQVARSMGVGFLLALLALIGLVVLLRKRLAAQIDRTAEQNDVLAEQYHQLAEQNEQLESAVRSLEHAERQQHALADELKLLTRRLAEAQHVAQLGYWEIDSASGAVFWSAEMYRLAGLEPGSQPPQTERFLDALHPDDQPHMREVAARALADLTEFTEQYRLIDPNGSLRTIQAKGRVFIDDNGQRKLIGTVQDVTDRLQLEARLRQSQKMEAIGQLAGGVAHDFNNLLTVIEGYTGLLLAENRVDAESRLQVVEVRDAARRAAALTRQLLAFSRQQVLRPHVLDVNEAIGGVERMLRRLIGAHIEFHTKLDPDLDRVLADPGQLEQVLMNLAVNARDAMPNGGKLTIETANVVLDASYAQRHPVKTPGPHVMLAVTDTGTGIDPSLLDRIFEPFFTTKEAGKGTGLGLSTVHGIVEQSGGHTWVYSEPGLGTTFKVYLPKCDAVEEALAPTPHREAPRRGTETILLVEDDTALRRMAAAILRRVGYRVIEAADGAEALRRAQDGATTFDLVVSDMVMPTMSGRELVNRLHELRPHVPSLLMSGYTRDSMVHSADLSVAASFIEKPFTAESLMTKVREVLDRDPADAFAGASAGK
jgi:two-component system cell cycle sensor histidine kinase/response regulator CckA